MTDLQWADARTQAELLKRKEVSQRELVDAAIERIEKLNPLYNAVIHERFDRARKERGVPIVVKDLGCEVTGTPQTLGNRVLRERNVASDHDTGWVAKLKGKFVILGKTNVPEFGTMPTTEPTAFGPTRNPCSADHSAGGSSGGSAAAVASGMVSVAHGTDGGGSVRIPASNCGLVGIKPTRARISMGPDAGESWMGASTSGPLARTVYDAAWLLDVLGGPQPGDPYAAPPLKRPLVKEVGQDPGRLRVGLLDHPARDGVTPHPEARAAVRATAQLLEAQGHAVEDDHPASLDDAGFSNHFLRIIAASLARQLAALGLSDEDVEPANAMFAGMGRALRADEYLESVQWMHRFQRRTAAWWEDHEVLVSPVLNGPPPRIGELSGPGGQAKVAELLQFTPQFNITGQPAISLPLHVTPDGLPMGVQLVAAYGREDLLVRLASQLEPAFAARPQ